MTSTLEGQINHPTSDGVVFGVGACCRRLGELLQRTGIHRALLVTTPSVARSPLLGMVRDSAGHCLVGEFTRSKAQSPKSVVLEVVEQARAASVDGFISLGGSWVVDVTKGAALMLAEGENLDRFLASAAAPAVFAHPSPRLPHIALPTTLSGAEYSPYAGITDEAAREKHVYFDKGLAPRWVVATNPRPVENPTALVEVLENAW